MMPTYIILLEIEMQNTYSQINIGFLCDNIVSPIYPPIYGIRKTYECIYTSL